MLNTTTKVTLSEQADCFLKCATYPVRAHLIGLLRDKIHSAGDQMVVIGMTCECDEHIYRAFKSYAYRPGIRIVFHIVRYQQHIHVDRIAWRDCDPYGDNG